MKRFIFLHINKPDTGFAVGIRLGKYTIALWLGYGKPVWWKPRFIGRGTSNWGAGFGWLLLCFRIQVINLERDGE